MSQTSGRTAAHVRRLHRIRVLLVSRDRPFLRVTSLLLGQHGFAVETTSKLVEVRALVPRHRANVVVLDVGDSLAEAVRTAATVSALRPPAGVILVGEDEDGLERLPWTVAPKWAVTEKLAADIERSYATLANDR